MRSTTTCDTVRKQAILNKCHWHKCFYVTVDRFEKCQPRSKRFKGTNLVEESFRELLEALGTNKTLFVIQLAIAVHNLLCRRKASSTAFTDGIGKSICHVAVRKTIDNVPDNIDLLAQFLCQYGSCSNSRTKKTEVFGLWWKMQPFISGFWPDLRTSDK